MSKDNSSPSPVKDNMSPSLGPVSAITVKEGGGEKKEDGEETLITPYTERQELSVGRLMGGGGLGLPGIACNGCAAAESCPAFKENSACAYEEDFSALPTRDLSNLIPRLEVIADMQFKRGMHAAYVERRKSGGQILPEVTRQLEIAAAAAERVARLKTPQQKNAASPISVIVQQNNGGSSGGGLVSRLMAGVQGKLSTPEANSGEITINAENNATPRHALPSPIGGTIIDTQGTEVKEGA